jgi:hypothetical protein
MDFVLCALAIATATGGIQRIDLALGHEWSVDEIGRIARKVVPAHGHLKAHGTERCESW